MGTSDNIARLIRVRTLIYHPWHCIPPKYFLCCVMYLCPLLVKLDEVKDSITTNAN